MGEIVIKMNNLTKKYGEQTAVKHLNMQIERGEIYGFIGENGAGKTTTIRLITGIAKPTEGSLELFGRSDLQKQRRKIGCIIEAPALYPEMTARENLDVQRISMGIQDKSTIPAVLKLVNLDDTGKKKAKNFSLGMKQRLALAIAMLGSPELLILDEPTNGLDPIGIMDMREILKRISQEQGVTILISSHLLSELYLVAGRFGIIHKGELLEQITVEELKEKCRKYVYLSVNDAEAAIKIMKEKLNLTRYEVLPGKGIRIMEYLDRTDRIAAVILESGMELGELSLREDNLETYYSNVIGGHNHDISNQG